MQRLTETEVRPTYGMFGYPQEGGVFFHLEPVTTAKARELFEERNLLSMFLVPITGRDHLAYCRGADGSPQDWRTRDFAATQLSGRLVVVETEQEKWFLEKCLEAFRQA